MKTKGGLDEKNSYITQLNTFEVFNEEEPPPQRIKISQIPPWERRGQRGKPEVLFWKKGFEDSGKVQVLFSFASQGHTELPSSSAPCT